MFFSNICYSAKVKIACRTSDKYSGMFVPAGREFFKDRLAGTILSAGRSFLAQLPGLLDCGENFKSTSIYNIYARTHEAWDIWFK